MAKLLFRLTHVPEDEALKIRDLLAEQEIEFYETTAGRWQLGVDAIWVKDQQSFARGREIIDQYQAELQHQAQQNSPISFLYGLWLGLRYNFGAMLITIVAILIVLLFVLAPFFTL